VDQPPFAPLITRPDHFNGEARKHGFPRGWRGKELALFAGEFVAGINRRPACETRAAGYWFGIMKPRQLACIFLAMFFTAFFAKGDPIDIGASLPAVTGTTETGAPLDLSTLNKGYTLVYFYPRAETSGCTAQGCSLRDAYDVLQKRDVTVIGVSTDPVEKQKAFKDNHHLPFTLVADPDKKVITAFGVPTRTIPAIGEIATRQAFLFKDGKLVWRDLKAATKKQANDVLRELDSIEGSTPPSATNTTAE
jgi:peroxiredoxin Q/BCP